MDPDAVDREQLALATRVTGPCIICRALLRPGRLYADAVEAFSPYDRILDEQPALRADLVSLVRTALALRLPAYVIANNRAEGSAPLTIIAVARMLIDQANAGLGWRFQQETQFPLQPRRRRDPRDRLADLVVGCRRAGGDPDPLRRAEPPGNLDFLLAAHRLVADRAAGRIQAVARPRYVRANAMDSTRAARCVVLLEL